jgi:hypothetical protein
MVLTLRCGRYDSYFGDSMKNISANKLAIRIAPSKVTRVEETPAMTQKLLKTLDGSNIFS